MALCVTAEAHDAVRWGVKWDGRKGGADGAKAEGEAWQGKAEPNWYSDCQHTRMQALARLRSEAEEWARLQAEEQEEAKTRRAEHRARRTSEQLALRAFAERDLRSQGADGGEEEELVLRECGGGPCETRVADDEPSGAAAHSASRVVGAGAGEPGAVAERRASAPAGDESVDELLRSFF
eukprot:4473912-Prymnesium_polylepis.1